MIQKELNLLLAIGVADYRRVRSVQLEHRLVFTVCWPLGCIELGVDLGRSSRGVRTIDEIEPASRCQLWILGPQDSLMPGMPNSPVIDHLPRERHIRFRVVACY